MLRVTTGVIEHILEHGLAVASQRGLSALTLGDVARELDLPRQGLVQSFNDKETLQLRVLEQAIERFQRTVVEATSSSSSSEQALRSLFQRWIAWARAPYLSGGCPFVHASREQDALPAAVRQRLKTVLDEWTQRLNVTITEAKASGHLDARLDVEQLIFELYGLYLSHHFWHWSMKDRAAEARTMKAFERLLAASRVPRAA